MFQLKFSTADTTALAQSAAVWTSVVFYAEMGWSMMPWLCCGGFCRSFPSSLLEMTMPGMVSHCIRLLGSRNRSICDDPISWSCFVNASRPATILHAHCMLRTVLTCQGNGVHLASCVDCWIRAQQVCKRGKLLHRPQARAGAAALKGLFICEEGLHECMHGIRGGQCSASPPAEH